MRSLTAYPILKRMETKTDTRIVGRAELNIEYANFSKQADPEEPIADLATGLATVSALAETFPHSFVVISSEAL